MKNNACIFDIEDEFDKSMIVVDFEEVLRIPGEYFAMNRMDEMDPKTKFLRKYSEHHLIFIYNLNLVSSSRDIDKTFMEFYQYVKETCEYIRSKYTSSFIFLVDEDYFMPGISWSFLIRDHFKDIEIIDFIGKDEQKVKYNIGLRGDPEFDRHIKNNFVFISEEDLFKKYGDTEGKAFIFVGYPSLCYYPENIRYLPCTKSYTKKARAKFIEKSHRKGFTVICIYNKSSKEIALDALFMRVNNEGYPDRVSSIMYDIMEKEMEKPSLDEGFEEIIKLKGHIVGDENYRIIR